MTVIELEERKKGMISTKHDVVWKRRRKFLSLESVEARKDVAQYSIENIVDPYDDNSIEHILRYLGHNFFIFQSIYEHMHTLN